MIDPKPIDEATEAVLDAIEAEHKKGSPAPQIIRTLEELEELDPETVTIDNEGALENVSMWLDDSGKTYPHDECFLPAVVIATGEQVRAARKALEEEHG